MLSGYSAQNEFEGLAMTERNINTLIPAADRDVPQSDNRPPLISANELASDHEDLLNALSALELEAENAPMDVANDETCGKLQDIVRAIDAYGRKSGNTRTGRIETLRQTIKQPFLAGEKTVDGFFNNLIDERCDKATRPLRDRVGNYLRAKEAAERRRRDEQARLLREEEERQRQVAREAEEAAAKLRERNRPTAAVQKETLAEFTSRQADQTAAQAIQAEQHAAAKPADLARTRSAGAGSLGTLRTTWDFEILDVAAIPAADLWAMIPRAAKETALRSYMRNNAPPADRDQAPWEPLPGVRFYRKTDTVIR
jgi:hypothetical protein